MIKDKLKNLTVAVAAILITFTSFAQNSEYRVGLGLNGGLREYNGDLGSALFMSRPTKYGGAGIDLGIYLSPSIDLLLWSSMGDVGYNTYLKDEVDPYKLRIFRTWTTDGNIGIRYKLNNGKLINEDALIAPYVQLGGGIFYGHGKVSFNPSAYTVWAGNLAGGLGINFNMSQRWNVRLQTIYNYTQNDIWDGEAGTTNHAITNRLQKAHDAYLYTSLGITYNFNAFGLTGTGGKSLRKVKDDDNDGIENKYDDCKNTPEGCDVDSVGCSIDSDGDGVVDCEDKCPKVKGEKMFDGCPDTDADGVQDSEDACPKVKGSVEDKGCPDTDGDGLTDNLDKCPNTPGPKENEGCPANDKDRDGVPDEKDKCPEVFGLAEFDGCPDSDGDGIPNFKDQCPNRAGTAEGEGCPDSDGDGVFDNKDVCPTVPGDAANKGCPAIKEEVKEKIKLAAQGIFFESGKDIIKTSSYVNLDQLAEILNEYKDAKVAIEGHTDSQGADDKNLALSQARANAVLKYLTDKGVAANRMTAIGYGESLPKADNGTSAGRALNRRVEFKLTY